VQDASNPEELANVDVEQRFDEQAAREGRPGPLDVAFLSNRENVTEILLIRHAHQLLDLGGAIGGYADPPLSDLGEQQAQLLGAALSTKRIDAVYASPLRRAIGTAEAIARHHRIEPVAIADLREVEVFRDAPQHLSSLEFMGAEALATLRHRFMEERTWDVYPYSESSAELRRRVIDAIETITSNHADGRVAVVCHGGVINAFVSHVIGSRFDVLFRPAHTSISIAASADSIHTLYTLNDVHHLSTVDGDFRSV
jgi:2,3-bisphosphoglycerate-dependent phosphoglycerate mutase